MELRKQKPIEKPRVSKRQPMNIWHLYELKKQKIRMKNLPDDEYRKAIDKLADELGV